MMDGTPLMNFGVNGTGTSGSAIIVLIHYAPHFYPLLSKELFIVARLCQVIFS
jgi:hypothetical protein